MSRLPFLTRVKLRNYKSIARCDVELGPLAILVGPNAAGKSNFLDALAFTHDALCGPLHKAPVGARRHHRGNAPFCGAAGQFLHRPAFPPQ